MTEPEIATTTPVIPTYRVSIWEGVGILAGAAFLVLFGLFGLVNKAARNASNPPRAEAIAQSLISYRFPGDSQGVFGVNIGSVKMAVVATPGIDANGSGIVTAPDNAVELLVARTPLSYQTDIHTPDANADTLNLISFAGFSVSYDLEGQFASTTARQERRRFCNVPVTIEIREGTVTPANTTTPVPAVRYEAIAPLDNWEHLVVLTAIGSSAQQNAESVFESLQCR